MRILCDVYDSTGNRQGSGPVTTLESVSVKKILDGCGTIQFSTPATDPNAINLLTLRRRIRIHIEDGDNYRELCRGVILKRELNDSSSGPTFTFTCSDNLEELKFRNTLIGRTYSQQTISTVVNALAALVPGWSATIEVGIASRLIDARFDGVSVLKALQSICQNNGVHLRVGSGSVVEVGEFGQLSTLSIMNTSAVTPELIDNTGVAIVESIDAGEDAEDIVNWIVPLGAGEDAAALKLKRSTRTSPYTIETGTGPNGRTYWFMRDTSSTALYGQVRKVVMFKDITPISNSATDKINAANQLYDAAAAYLQRAGVAQNNYSVRILNVGAENTIKPGDKINVRYTGRVYRDGAAVDYVSINQDMWVISVNEHISPEGHEVQLDISNIDKTPKSAASMVVEAMEQTELRGLQPITNVSRGGYVYQREIAPGFPAIVPVEFTDATLELLRCYVRIKTSPFRATSQSAANGGDHRHLVAIQQSVGGAPANYRVYSFINSAGTLPVSLMLADGNVIGDAEGDLYTYGYSGEHTHALAFGISDDTQTPSSISIYVDGINRTAALGGPFMAGGGNADFTLNVGLITDYLVNAAGGLQQAHTIEIRCTGGRGRVEVTVEFYEVIQGIATVAAID